MKVACSELRRMTGLGLYRTSRANATLPAQLMLLHVQVDAETGETVGETVVKDTPLLINIKAGDTACRQC